MKLKIRCDYKRQKLHIESDANHIRLVMLIIDTYHRRKNRYSFLLALTFLVLSLLSALMVPVFYLLYQPEVVFVVVMLASIISKQGPPVIYNLYQ